MLKKASLGNSAAQISTAIVESNELITFTTTEAHSIFEGAKVTVTGITGTTGVSPNVSNALVYKINNATSFSVKPNTNFTYTGAFPASLSASSDATVYSINGSLLSSALSFAQPEKIVRPVYFNFISPELSLVASGNGILVTWDAIGVSNPQATISVERILGTTSTVISTAATSVVSSTVSYLLDGSLSSGAEYTYKVTALNSISSNTTIGSVTTLYINPIPTLTAIAKPSTANTVSLSWTAPQTNAAISEYEISRSSNGGSSWSALATTSSSVFSYEDATATANGSTSYTYRIRAKAAYAVGIGGDIYSSYTSSSAILPYFISTTTPTAATVASTANRLLVSWSAVSAATPAVTSYQLQRASSSNNATWSAWSDVTLSSLTATSYSDTSASSALYYKYRVRALNPQLTSAYVESNSLRAFYLNDPLTPAPVVTRASTSNANLVISGSYAANPSITSYEIRRSSNAGSTWTTVAASAASLPYTDSTAAQNTTYIYQIKATNGELTTANWSASSTSILTYAVPNPPTSISATSITSTSIRVNWSGASTNAAGPAITNYRVEYKLASDSTWVTATTVSSATALHTVTGLTTDSSYNFRVFAINTIGTSNASSTATATPVRVADTSVSLATISGNSPFFNTTQSFRAATAPGRDAILQISSTGTSGWSNLTSYTSDSDGIVTLTWTANTTSVRYFRLFVDQDALYTANTSNVVTVYPQTNELNVSLYSASLTDFGTYAASTLTSSDRTVTILVTDVYGTPVPSASITWYKAQYQNTSYATINTGTTDSNGRASLNITDEITAGRITGSTSFEINARVSKSGYDTAEIDSWYYTLYIRETIQEYADYGYSYKDNGERRGDNSANNLYTGYYDSSWGMQKSALGFTDIDWNKIDASNNGAGDSSAIISATLRLNSGNPAGSGDRTAYLGTHEDGGALTSDFDLIPGKSIREQSFNAPQEEQVNIALDGSMRELLFSGGVRGILIGPPTSTSLTGYTWFYGVTASTSLRPRLTIIFTVDPIWRIS